MHEVASCLGYVYFPTDPFSILEPENPSIDIIVYSLETSNDGGFKSSALKAARNKTNEVVFPLLFFHWNNWIKLDMMQIISLKQIMLEDKIFSNN